VRQLSGRQRGGRERGLGYRISRSCGRRVLVQRGAPGKQTVRQTVGGNGRRVASSPAGHGLNYNRRRNSGGEGVADQRLNDRQGHQTVRGHSAGAAGDQLFLRIEGVQVDAEILRHAVGYGRAGIGEVDEGITDV